MDGDFDSAMRDAGWGTDEDYGYYGEDYWWDTISVPILKL